MRVVEGYILDLTLTNGMKVRRDFSQFVERGATGVLRPLADAKFFSRVRVSHGTLEWPGELDFCPDVVVWGGPPRRGRPPKTASFPLLTSRR